MESKFGMGIYTISDASEVLNIDKLKLDIGLTDM